MCRPPLDIVVGCTTDDECGDRDACINNVCKDPCACGRNAECSIVNHRPVCTCKKGFYGDPEILCETVGCQSNDDCEETHECRQGTCTPVCGPEGLPCGGNALCQGINHQYVCTCPVGLEGDPYVSCSSVECTDNSDCPPDKACVNKFCQDPCAIENPCTNSAECSVIGHEPNCKCPAGQEGDRGNSCKIGTSGQKKPPFLTNFLN